MMADGVSYELEGIEALLGKLDSVTEDVKYKGGRFALRKAAQKMRDQAKQNAERVDDPESPTRIADNIVERWSNRRFKKTGDLMFRVGVLGGAKRPATAVGEIQGAGSGNPGGDTYYWRYLEFGTAKMAAQPFMRPAQDQAGQAIVSEFSRQYSKAVDRAIKRAKKKRAK